MNNKIDGGFAIVNTLRDLGVRDIFTLAGGHVNPIYNACREMGIRLIDTHHEQGASMAADAYGRVTKSPGVCLVTAGPGLTNAMTGMSGAFLSNSPCIFLSGKAGIEEIDRLPLQDIDQESMVRPITKWAKTVYDTKRLAEYTAHAYKMARSGRPGPVYLGFPHEVLYEKIDSKELDRSQSAIPSNPEISDVDVQRFLEMIRESSRPVVIAGSGSWYSGASDMLEEFVNQLDVPTFTLNFGRGVVSDKHKNCLGQASPSALNGFKKITSEADLIILLGVRLSLYIGWGRTFNPSAKIVQVDIESEEIGRNIPAHLPIISDINKALIKVNDRLAHEPIVKDAFSEWMNTCIKWKDAEWKAITKLKNSDTKPLHVLRVVKSIEDVLGEDAMLCIDGGDTQAWTDSVYQVSKGGLYVKGGPLGCMGVGVPFAIGSKVAFPERQVALISGDGAIGMNLMEFETAVKHKIPFVSIVCNDQSWGMTKHQHWLNYGRDNTPAGHELPFINYHEIVKAMGGYGEMVTEADELSPAIERACNSDLPSLINVITNPDATSAATLAITAMMTPKEKD
ncbi:MAG: thiamine pyrophosphate-binding protein [Thermodesulfobacteriota bacterium]|nr:thiamine pyrophosphate-binding protein [Thermodesulfobacteriota bacterium]